MADLIGALTKKRVTLCERKRRIQAEANQQIHEIDREIASIDEALATLNEAVKEYACPRCHGTGEERYTDAAGSRDYRECPHCGGTGIKRNDNE